jgi:hypothetical protein
MENPYSPPAFESIAAPQLTLYSPGQMAWATFLGAPVAGCVLLALNCKRLGHSAAAGIALVGGFTVTVLLLVVSFFLPDNFPNLALPAAYTFGMYQCVKLLQGKEYEHHLAIGGTRGSGWVATGVGILCLILILVAMFAVLFAMPDEWFGEEVVRSAL